MKSIEGDAAAAKDARFALVASKFNSPVVEGLIQGATDALKGAGVPDARITLVKVPGAFEIPLAAQEIAAAGKVDAIVALGAVIRGETPHFDYVAGECARGLTSVSLATGLPIAFGVLTTDTAEQAFARAGKEPGRNKGADAAMTALEMVALLRELE